MSLLSSMQNFGQGVGNMINVGTNLAMKDAQINEMKTDTAYKQMEMQMRQKEMQDQQESATDFAAAMKDSQDGLSMTQKLLQASEKVETDFLSKGNYKAAMAIEDRREKLDSKLKEEQVTQAAEGQRRKESFGLAAQTYVKALTEDPSNISAYGAELAKSAAAAGMDPKKIPQPGTPEFAQFAQMSQTQGLHEKDALEFGRQAKQDAELAQQRKLDAEEKELKILNQKRENAERQINKGLTNKEMLDERDKALTRGQTAQHYADENRHWHEQDELARKKASGDTLGAKDRTTANNVATLAGDVAMHLGNISKFALKDSPGVLSNLDDKTAVTAFAALTGRLSTPEMDQMISAASSGLTKIYTNLEGAGLSRLPTDTQYAITDKALGIKKGDAPGTKLYKLSLIAQGSATRVKNSPDSPLPKLKAVADESLQSFAKWGDPDQIRQLASRDPKARREIEDYDKSFAENMANIQESFKSAPSAEGLPAVGNVKTVNGVDYHVIGMRDGKPVWGK